MKRQIQPQAPTQTDEKPSVDDLLKKMRELEDKQLKEVQGGCQPADICASRCNRCRMS